MPRPKKPEAERTSQRTHRLVHAHWQEFDELGGIKWLRAQLEKSARKRRRASGPAR